jgi:hypothetical protein
MELCWRVSVRFMVTSIRQRRSGGCEPLHTGTGEKALPNLPTTPRGP